MPKLFMEILIVFLLNSKVDLKKLLFIQDKVNFFVKIFILDIAKTITEMFDVPIELKFEKVYHPMILLAKKRYVGYKKETFESIPQIDGKGLEIVRRDGSDLGQRVMRDILEILFTTSDLSKAKNYMNSIWTKLEQGKINIKEYVIAKELKSRYKMPPP